MHRQNFDRELLLSVVRPVYEPHAYPPKGPIARQSDDPFALAIFRAPEDAVGLLSTLYTLNPNARILELTAPEGKDNLKQYRAMLTELLIACGETPLRHRPPSQMEAYLVKLLQANADYVVIHHAERMGAYALEALRRDRGNPPVILIAYSDQVLDTVLSQEDLLRRTVLLT
jgi:hypothetical protein